MEHDTELEALYNQSVEIRTKIVEHIRSKARVIDTSYVFTEGDATTVGLHDLFGENNDLIVIHNMGRSCRYCSFWADGLNGFRRQIESRTSFVVMNGDSAEDQRAIAQARGWEFRMIRDTAGTFTDDMGFLFVKDGKSFLYPGFSVFHRADDGTITRTGFDMFGPGDVYNGVFHMFDLLEDRGAGWMPLPT